MLQERVFDLPRINDTNPVSLPATQDNKRFKGELHTIPLSPDESIPSPLSEEMVPRRQKGASSSQGDHLFASHGEAVTSFGVLGMVKEAKDEFRFGNVARAETILIQALQEDPRNVDAYHTLGMIYLGRRSFLDAIDAFKTVLKYDRSHVSAKVSLAFIYTTQKKYADAVKLYKELIAAEGRSAGRFVSLGGVYEAWGKYDKAILAYQEGVRIDPRNTEVSTRLMEAALITHRNDVAIQAARDTLAVSPTNVRVRQVLEQQGVPYDRPPHS